MGYNQNDTKEIKRRIGIAKNATIALTAIRRSRSTSLKTKKRLIGSLVYPTATYGSECWVLRMSDKKHLESFELWCYRRPHGKSWTKKVTNESVFHEINCDMGLLDSINTRQLAFVGHTLRPDCLEKTLLRGVVPGSRGRGRPKYLRYLRPNNFRNV